MLLLGGFTQTLEITIDKGAKKMRGRNKDLCLNCNDEMTAHKRQRHIFDDYTDINMNLITIELSDVQKFDKENMCDNCYDLVHG